MHLNDLANVVEADVNVFGVGVESRVSGKCDFTLIVIVKSSPFSKRMELEFDDQFLEPDQFLSRVCECDVFEFRTQERDYRLLLGPP